MELVVWAASVENGEMEHGQIYANPNSRMLFWAAEIGPCHKLGESKQTLSRFSPILNLMEGGGGGRRFTARVVNGVCIRSCGSLCMYVRIYVVNVMAFAKKLG